jgi:Protein of unknown function (DUF3300)
MRLAKHRLCAFVSTVVVCATWSATVLAREASPAAAQEVYVAATDDELDALVAPIALYPDPLVAEVLGAATYPDQVVEADTYVRANMGLPWEELIKGAEERSWDPSVTALVQFSGVLNRLAKNITWTSTLGEAAANQQSELMAAIQRMRAKAYAAGNLKSGERIRVVQESAGVILIQPTNAKMVYVPSYNPSLVYGNAVTTPSYTPPDAAATGTISFGLGVAVGAVSRGPACGWHYGNWRINWSGQVVYCGGGIYFGNPYWWGGYYPGFYAGYRSFDSPTARPPTPSPPGSPPPRANGPGMPTTRPGPGVPNTRPSTEELRGYPAAGKGKAEKKPNAFSGTLGGRAESARGNRSLNGSEPAPNSHEARQ